LAALSTAWFTTLRRDFTPPPAPAHGTRAGAVALDAQARELIVAARPISRDPRMQVLHVLHARERTRMPLAGVPGAVPS